MGVLEFKRIEKPIKWIAGKARCSVCHHIHVGVAPSGIEWLRCPRCKLQKSRFIRVPVPEVIYTCSCGCDVFYIVPDGFFCVNCAKTQRF